MRRWVSKLREKVRDNDTFPSPAVMGHLPCEPFPEHRHIRLITFNIQVGINTASYRHYLTRSWQHFLPSEQRLRNLDRIAVLLKQYDIAALQECDGGSIRSGHVNQVQYLAERSGHPFWYQQLNRNLGRFAQHSNGLLSRFSPLSVEEVQLPGLIPGRGAILVRYGLEENPLVLVIVHLALGARTQRQQIEHLVERIQGYRNLVFMGDFNAHADRLLGQTALSRLNLEPLPEHTKSFPSWRPERGLDHILVSGHLSIRNAGVVRFPVSDHLPVALDIALPDA